MNRKEYNDRWNAPLVNPLITLGEYEMKKRASAELSKPMTRSAFYEQEIADFEAMQKRLKK